MEFVEGSGGIYRPIRVLFDTPIYDRALQLCWTMSSYKSQIALVRELLRLQQKKLIPSQVTAEDMTNLLLEESKSSLRERLWEFELEDFDEEDAKPLLMLVWAVNVSNKMRDVECEARMLLNSPEALPRNFQHPKFLSLAKDYAKILRKNQREAPSSKQLCPKEVVFEVVPRVLQGFWALPPHPLLNMPSQRLSTMSVGVTKAVLDKVCDALTGVERQATFSRSIRDEMVLSILTTIRQTHPHDILVNRIKSFAPVLLREIVDVTVGQICGLFQPHSPKVPAHQMPTVKPPATPPVQDDSNLPTPSPETTSAVMSPPPSAEAPSMSDVEAREDVSDTHSLENDPEPSREPDSAAVPAFSTPPAEPPSIADVEAREDVSDKSSLKNDSEPSREPDSAVVQAVSTPPVEPPSVSDVEAREDVSDKPHTEKDQEPTRNPDSAVVPVTFTPPAEPPSADVEAREDERDTLSLENDTEPTREPASALVPATLTLPAEPPFIDVEAREDKSDSLSLKKDPEPRDSASAATPARPAPVTPPVELIIITEVQDGLTAALTEIEEPINSAEVPSPFPWTSPAEPLYTADVQDREGTKERPSLEEDPIPSRAPDSAVVSTSSAPLTPPLEPVIIVTESEVEMTEENTAQGFFHWLFKPLCCCFK